MGFQHLRQVFMVLCRKNIIIILFCPQIRTVCIDKYILCIASNAPYRQQVQRLQRRQEELKEYIKTYSAMKPKEAAGIFDTMTDNLGLVADILEGMSAEQRADILEQMNKDTAAKLTAIMEPEQ